jgi:hypothetical protein
MRHSVLHPLGLSEGQTRGPGTGTGAGTAAYPGPIKNTGADARPLNPSPEGEGGEA